MKPRPAVWIVLCLLAAALLAVPHAPPTTATKADALVLTRSFRPEPSRSASRFLAMEHEPPSTTTTTVAPTTTTTPVTTPPTTVRKTTTTLRKSTISPTTTAANTQVVSSSSGDMPIVPQSCYGHKMSRDQAMSCWMPLLVHYHWPASKAFSVLYCESTGSNEARNGIYHGLFQVENGSFDPYANVALAFDYYSRRGWQPWSCA